MYPNVFAIKRKQIYIYACSSKETRPFEILYSFGNRAHNAAYKMWILCPLLLHGRTSCPFPSCLGCLLFIWTANKASVNSRRKLISVWTAKLTTRSDFAVNKVFSTSRSLSLSSSALHSVNTLRQTVHTLFLAVNKQPTDFSSSVKIISPGCNYRSQSMARCSITITPLWGPHRIKNKSVYM